MGKSVPCFLPSVIEESYARHVMYLVPDLSELLGCRHAVLTNSKRPATRDKRNDDEQEARGEWPRDEQRRATGELQVTRTRTRG